MSPSLFEELKLKRKQKLHPKFLTLRDTPSLINQKKQLEKWFEGFEDRDNKIVKEFQTSFHSTLWEIYLYTVLKDIGYEIDFSYNRPDFILKDNPNILVEATTANPKQGYELEHIHHVSQIPDLFEPPNEQSNFEYEMNEIIARYSNSILGKHSLYEEKYTQCEWVTPENPFVIALGSYARVKYVSDYIYGMIAFLYGQFFNPNDNDFIFKETITKNGTNSELPLGIFLDEQYSNISAIIFSTTTTIGKLTATVASNNSSNGIATCAENNIYNLYRDFTDNDVPYKIMIVNSQSPEVLADGLFVFHNPNAKNKLSFDTFRNTGVTQYYFDALGNKIRFGNSQPTISRLSVPKILAPLFEEKIYEHLLKYNDTSQKNINQFI